MGSLFFFLVVSFFLLLAFFGSRWDNSTKSARAQDSPGTTSTKVSGQQESQLQRRLMDRRSEGERPTKRPSPPVRSTATGHDQIGVSPTSTEKTIKQEAVPTAVSAVPEGDAYMVTEVPVTWESHTEVRATISKGLPFSVYPAPTMRLARVFGPGSHIVWNLPTELADSNDYPGTSRVFEVWKRHHDAGVDMPAAALELKAFLRMAECTTWNTAVPILELRSRGKFLVSDYDYVVAQAPLLLIGEENNMQFLNGWGNAERLIRKQDAVGLKLDFDESSELVRWRGASMRLQIPAQIER